VGDTPLDTLAQVREREARLPTDFHRRVDRDLGTVCLKCLEKDAARRYGSAEALAEDLERWLAGEPIVARRVPFLGRLVRRAKRNPTLAAAVGLFLCTMLAAAAAAGWGFWRYTADLRRATGIAEGHRQEAERQRK